MADLGVGSREMESAFRYSLNLTTCCDVISGHITLFGQKGGKPGQNSISCGVFEFLAQNFAFGLTSGWGVHKWSHFHDILKI